MDFWDVPGLMVSLKDKNFSIKDKLKLSKFAWGSDDVHIPNKQQQLLDFLSGLLVNKKKHNLKGKDVVLTWKSFLMFLQVSSQSVYIKPSILQAVFDDLGGRARAESGTKATVQDSELLCIVISCACRLLQLPSVASAQFDLLCSVLQVACHVKCDQEEHEVLEATDKLILGVLPVLVKCQRAHLNQAQVLHTVLEKTLAPTLKVIGMCDSHLGQSLQNFLMACLMHSDNLEGYTVYLRHSCGEPSPGQPKQPPKIMTTLFSLLSSLLNQPDSRTAAIEFIPLLLKSFMKEKKSEPRLCFLMLKRLAKLMVPTLGSEHASANTSQEVKSQSNTVSGDWWLNGITMCMDVCGSETDLDLFSASRQNGDILTWFSNLMHMVIEQERNPHWFDFMRHMLSLNHLVVEKSWSKILKLSLASLPESSEKARLGQDWFLQELVSVYVKLRRTSDLLSALMSAAQAGQGRIAAVHELGSFESRLCSMFSEVPLTALLEMWDAVQAQAVLAVDKLALSQDNTETLYSLDWILGLYTALLGNARLFDHRSAGAFAKRISGLVNSVGDKVLTPLYAVKEVKSLCQNLPRLLRTWLYLQALLLPRWHEDDQTSSGIEQSAKMEKWIKRLKDFDQAKFSLQRTGIASPEGCPVSLKGSEGDMTLEQAVENLLEKPCWTLDSLSLMGSNQSASGLLSRTAFANYTYLCQLLQLGGKRLPDKLLQGCADLTFNILAHGYTCSWTNGCASYSSKQEQTTLLQLARNLILHPATRELRPFQQRLATQALAELLSCLSFASPSPPKKKKKLVSSAGSSSAHTKLLQFLTSYEVTLKEMSGLDLSKMNAEISTSLKSSEMVKVLSCLDLEYLPEVNLRCQIGSPVLLTCLTNRKDCEELTTLLEDLYVRCLSVPNTSQLFMIIPAEELIKFAVEYTAQKPGLDRPVLEVSVQAVMSEHRAVQHMRQFTKQLLSNLGDDITRSGCIKFQLVSLMVKGCQKYVRKAFHIPEVGEAAKEVYFSVAKFVIKHGLSWFQKFEQSYMVQDAERRHKGEKKQKEAEKRLRKRKRQPEDEKEEPAEEKRGSAQGMIIMGLVDQAGGDLGYVLEAWTALFNCVSEVLDLWEVQAADAKVNQHLQQLVSQILNMVLERSPLKMEKAELTFIQSCCYCEMRSWDQSGQEVTEENPSGGGLLFLTAETHFKLWGSCLQQARKSVDAELAEISNHTRSAASVGLHNSQTLCGKLFTDPGSEGREAWLKGTRGSGPATDVLCALLESADLEMFSTLLGQLLDCLVSSNDLDPSVVIVAVDVWRKLMASSVLAADSSAYLFKTMYQLLSSVLSIVQNFAHVAPCEEGRGDKQNAVESRAYSGRRVACRCIVGALADFADLGKNFSHVAPCEEGRGDKQNAVESRAYFGRRFACRCIVGALADFADLGKTQVTPRMTILCLHVGFSLDLSHPADVEVMCGLLNNLLVRHANTILTAVPAVLDSINNILSPLDKSNTYIGKKSHK
ncbi:unhealthy ribosome biogenesis protein 2 homolog [Plakobranchus ocellatus]|uniref:Unhealthy ribosome biogenesis protein 2 homolog n=1 Tax=Plakobranchus ocellatus TaxID=259542 RepID=A0AAV4AB11_9GAST|nr:unhealthy ribosome biogenesis protein 2 homolog [Plakobranchus ocellatus]